MPTYEYRCKQCKHEMEEFQSMKDEPLVECPACHTPNLVRLISAGTGLIFKGKGFYLTDYKNGTSQATTSGSPKPKDDGSKADGPKSEGSKSEGTSSEGSKGDAPKAEGPKAESAVGTQQGGSGSSAAPAQGSSAKNE